jgi:hypothetical protein
MFSIDGTVLMAAAGFVGVDSSEMDSVVGSEGGAGALPLSTAAATD